MGRSKYLITGMVMALALLIPSMISDVYAETSSLSQCRTLDIPGTTYVLSQDLTTTEVCFRIVADGITLDGNGHTITSLITPDQFQNIGVDVSGTSGVTVKNLNIIDFRNGISVSSSDTSLIDNTITNSETGIRVSNSCVADLTGNTVTGGTHGIVVAYSSGVTLSWNTTNENSQNGIDVTGSHGTVLTGNTAGISDNTVARGIAIKSSNDNFLIENTASGNEAIMLHNSHNNILINNAVESCSNCNTLHPIGVTGIMIWDSNGNTVHDNNVDSTHLWGIRLLNSNDNKITNNIVSNHKNQQLASSILSGATALHISNSDNNSFYYNTISDNQSPYYIIETTNNKIYNNNFVSNLEDGKVRSYVLEYGIIMGVISDTSGSNIFNLDLPIGGNYWDIFDESSEGCEDIDLNKICDVEFISLETQDNLPWTVPDGWSVNSETIPDINSLEIPEAAQCSSTEPVITPEPEITIENNSDDINEDTPVLVCHMPPGNTDNPEEILISYDAHEAHLAHGDYIGSCDEYVPEILFVDEFISENETLNTALDFLSVLRKNLNDGIVDENSISEAAELHKLFVNEDKVIKQAFQSAFKQFNKDVKAYYGNTQVVSEKVLLHELDKTLLKIQIQINQAEKEEQVQDKIQSVIQFVNTQNELQKVKNQIALEKLKFEDDSEELNELKLFELELLKQTLFFTAKIDGDKISPDLLRTINEWAENEIAEQHKKNDGNNN
ncbi:MAG: NosD domain-containing protein, partial [Nitrosopumilaceae archaeon]